MSEWGADAPDLPAPAGPPRDWGGDPWGPNAMSQREAALPEVPPIGPPRGWELWGGLAAGRCSWGGAGEQLPPPAAVRPVAGVVSGDRRTDGRPTDGARARRAGSEGEEAV